MKKKIILVLIVFVVLVLCMGNAINLAVLMGSFTNTVDRHLSGGIVEIKSVYGKLNGNGNGIQYFGAALVKEDSVQDLDALVAELEQEFEVVEVLRQQSSKIESRHLEHRELTFSAEIPGDGGYLAICFFNSDNPFSNPADIAGH